MLVWEWILGLSLKTSMRCSVELGTAHHLWAWYRDAVKLQHLLKDRYLLNFKIILMGISTCPPVSGSLPTQTVLWVHVLPRNPSRRVCIAWRETRAIQTTAEELPKRTLHYWWSHIPTGTVFPCSHTEVWKMQTNSQSIEHLDLARVFF